MTTECNQFVFGFIPQNDARSGRSSTAEGSPVMAVICCCGRSRSAFQKAVVRGNRNSQSILSGREGIDRDAESRLW
jgi:hypothetical protein